MEQNPSQNQNEGFFRKNQNYIIAAVIVVLAIILFATSRGDDSANQDGQNDQNQEQTEGGQNNENGEENQDEEQSDEQASEDGDAMEEHDAMEGEGNVSARGTLRASDDATKGNLMLESDQGKIYVQTSRDFRGFIGKEVTLQAEGALDSFTFLGFKEGVADGGAMEDKGGDNETDDKVIEEKPETGDTDGGEISLSGRLENSDNAERGNYVINSGEGKIYLKTVRDYAAWVGSDVMLTATGTIDNFSGAVLTKK